MHSIWNCTDKSRAAMSTPSFIFCNQSLMAHGCQLTRSRAAFSSSFFATANFRSRSVSCWACKMKERYIFLVNSITFPLHFKYLSFIAKELEKQKPCEIHLECRLKILYYMVIWLSCRKCCSG